MIAAYIVLAALFLIALSRTIGHHANRVVDALAAIEQRQAETERNRGLDANQAAFDKLGVTR